MRPLAPRLMAGCFPNCRRFKPTSNFCTRWAGRAVSVIVETLMSQLHLAMLKAHNAFVDEAQRTGVSNDRVFDEAARQLRWHYQWLILNEFLPTLVGETLADQVLREGPQWFGPGHCGFIPLEFADAAYRYGHSQIRHRYRLNLQTDPVPLIPDLLGFRAVPRERAIDWTLFFDAPGAPPAQRSKKMDGKLVRALIELPVAVTGECEIENYHSLAVRDLQRGQGVGLPSGEAVARQIGVTPLTRSRLALLPRAGMERLLCGTTFSAKPTFVQAVIVLVQWVAGSWRRYWLDSSMRTRHRFDGATRIGGRRKHLVNC
jgi:hypothetical protein